MYRFLIFALFLTLNDNVSNTVTDDKSKADILSNFFYSVFTEEYAKLPSFDVQVDNAICDIVVNVQKVRELLISTNTMEMCQCQLYI